MFPSMIEPTSVGQVIAVASFGHSLTKGPHVAVVDAACVLPGPLAYFQDIRHECRNIFL